MKTLVDLYQEGMNAQRIPPLFLLAAFNLDVLCIHPFRDGNGRVSRLLLLLQCYHLGLEVGRYISIERLIEQNKVRYYETLEQSSQGWHDGNHDPWSYTHFLLFVLKSAYREFERRLGEMNAPKGEKTRLVIHAIDSGYGNFSVADLQRECPNVSMDMIRRILKKLQSEQRVACLGRGRNAQWQKTGKWELGNIE